MKEAVKDVLRTMHVMGNDAEDCLSLLQTAFIYNSSKTLNDCRDKVEGMKRTESRLTRDIAELARDNPALKPYVSVPVHLMRIGEGLEKLTELVGKKAKEGILFSDRAVTEITYLLQRLIDILRPTSDIILARNDILSRYVQESEADLEKRAIEYATSHENRLIEGVCLPIASSLYITMLDAIKGMAWHAKEVATKLAG